MTKKLRPATTPTRQPQRAVIVRLTPDECAALRRLAQSNRRSMSRQVAALIMGEEK